MSRDPKSSYYDVGGIETWEYMKAKLTKEQLVGYCVGAILKYASRFNFKGQKQRDLEKIAHYAKMLEDLIGENN